MSSGVPPAPSCLTSVRLCCKPPPCRRTPRERCTHTMTVFLVIADPEQDAAISAAVNKIDNQIIRPGVWLIRSKHTTSADAPDRWAFGRCPTGGASLEQTTTDICLFEGFQVQAKGLVILSLLFRSHLRAHLPRERPAGHGPRVRSHPRHRVVSSVPGP